MTCSPKQERDCFREYANGVLCPDAQGKIQLGELEYLIVSYLLDGFDTSLSEQFHQRFDYLIGSGNPPLSSSRAITAVLREFVLSGSLRESEAHDIGAVALSVTSFCLFVQRRYQEKNSSITVQMDSIPFSEAIEQAHVIVKTYELARRRPSI